MTMDGTAHSVDRWDLIVAHPPCTYLTNAGARHLYKGGKLNEQRYKQGMEARDFFMEFYDAGCEHIAIENPIASKVFELPKYAQIIQPYWFGHPVTKKTCLWLKNLPELYPTDIVERPQYREFIQKNGKKRRTCWEMEQKSGKNRAKERSKTFPGIAEAFASQWGDYLLRESDDE